jgi:hypothetical protein
MPQVNPPLEIMTHFSEKYAHFPATAGAGMRGNATF